MNDTAIKIDKLSKSFKLPHEKHDSIKSIFLNGFNIKRKYEKQEVLDDISLEIKKGDFFGIVGRNGSGKSTLLKIMSEIYTADSGSVEVNGNLVPFIELGVGFNKDLTGRENVFLNGALLGFNRKEMAGMYDEIVDFAELKQFMDQKLKNYSSGMKVRLAFSIAIRAQSDILVLDEVLAVGDAGFQNKCLEYFDTIKRQKDTVVLVTHDMATVEKYCNKAILIEDGKIIEAGDPQKVANEYTAIHRREYLKKEAEHDKTQDTKTQRKTGASIKLHDSSQQEKNRFKPGDQAVLEVSWTNPTVKNVGVALLKRTGEYVYGTNTIADEFDISSKSLLYKIKLDISQGDYIFKVGFFGEKAEDKIDFVDKGPYLYIETDEDQDWGGITKLESEWG